MKRRGGTHESEQTAAYREWEILVGGTIQENGNISREGKMLNHRLEKQWCIMDSNQSISWIFCHRRNREEKS